MQPTESANYKSFFVPDFPINMIVNTGTDGWVSMPAHPRNVYGYLDIILEHIENTNYIEPIMIHCHNINDISAGPNGVSRLYALTHIKKLTTIPAIASININYLIDLNNIQDKVEITTAEQLRSYFILEPASYGIDPNGQVFWQNQNPNKEQASKTLNISKESLERFLKSIAEG